MGVFGGVVVNLVHARGAGEPPGIPEGIDLFWLRHAGENEVRRIVQGYNKRVGQSGLGDHALEENHDESLFYPGKLVYSTARRLGPAYPGGAESCRPASTPLRGAE